ncbi:MAG: peptidase and chymotrypsin/Hap [Microvirga sp.]|nr:peptidase and chymotrypsin/Hap [Microvirga sp.]
MRDRFTRIALLIAIILLIGFVATNVELFERAAPSVVHVFAQARARRESLFEGEEGGGQQTGTGFVWDAAGHIVTNNHVVQNASPIAIRLNSGEIVRAELVGTAPNYDLAVLRLGRVRQPPPAIAVGTSSSASTRR